MKKISKYFSVVGLLFALQINAQTINNKISTNTHINYANLNKLDALVNEYISKGWETGMSVLVVKDQQLVYYKGFGVADVKTKAPMQADALYRIMSQSKAITSLAIMQLFEQGKLELDNPVSKFIPTFKNPQVVKDYNSKDTTYTTIDAKRQVTIRDLLTHTSGIDYTDIGSSMMSAIYNKANIPSGLGYFNANLIERMTALGSLPLAHQPGAKFTYGLNSDVLGAIVEIISGMSLEQYFNKNIFEPMGMQNTYFNVPENKKSKMPNVYTENDQHEIIEWPNNYRKINSNYPWQPKTYFSGGAGLSATAFDYAQFLQMLLNKGKYNGHQIISSRAVEVMTSPQLDFKYDGSNDFSLGFDVQSEKSAKLKMRNAGSFSWGGYYGTNYWADPKANLIVLIMTQHTPNSHGELKNKMENIIYSALQ
jgi:CubicO group peptidase (beta-lactamase class C family)